MFVEINGVLLYQRRKAAQLTLDKLARASGLSFQALTTIEAHAHTACNPMVLAKLITALRCTDEALLYRAGDGTIAARVETFFEKIERNGIALTEVLKRALHPNSGETMRFRARIICDLLARNFNNIALQCDAKAIYTIIFDSHLCTSELEFATSSKYRGTFDYFADPYCGDFRFIADAKGANFGPSPNRRPQGGDLDSHLRLFARWAL